MEELWLPAVGYEGLYEFSSHGRIASLPRTVKHRWSQWQMVPGGPIKAFRNSGCYKVNLYDEDNKPKMWAVHRLVAFAHLGPCPEGMIVRHGPKGAWVNHVDNLSYGTYKQNTHDRWRDGTYFHGSRVPNAKLTEKEALEIFHARLDENFRRRDLAAQYNVSEATIKSIRAGRNWKYATLICTKFGPSG